MTMGRGMGGAGRAVGLLLAITVFSALGSAQQPRSPQRGFPHERHARLFPTCAGCHAGAFNGDSTTLVPPPTVCAQCHNGEDQAPVSWSGPARVGTNLTFTHADHLASSTSAGNAATCKDCHVAPADTAWMHVRAAAPTVCIACHANQSGQHLAPDAVCTTCHTPLVRSPALTTTQIAGFPKPASHASADFISTHAPRTPAALAQCATCHSRESCERCHANASTVPQIMQLGTDARVKDLVQSLTARYPTPASHAAADWAQGGHGDAAAASPAGRGCANCHTQPACATCHVGGTGTTGRARKAIAALPMPVQNGAPGVQLANARVHPADFLAQHKTTAASGRLDCTQCHQERECTSCHAGNSSRQYHPLDFMSRHAAAAYAQDQTCATCHRTETFCRSCHLANNVAAKGARTGTGHTGQPLWLLQHGEAARLNLTGCTTCHQQRDCLRCHSATGLHVNPHGAGFDAAGMSSRYKQMCATCHLTDPLKK